MLRDALDSRAQLTPCAGRRGARPRSAAPRSSTSCWCWSCWCRCSSASSRSALVLLVRNTLAAAASEGARYAATLDRGPADGAARTRAQIDGRGLGPLRPGRRRAGRRRRRRARRRGRPCTRACRRSGIGGPAVALDVAGPRGRGGSRDAGAGGARRAGQRAGRAVLARASCCWCRCCGSCCRSSRCSAARSAVSAAARAAGRAYALAPDDADGPAGAPRPRPGRRSPTRALRRGAARGRGDLPPVPAPTATPARSVDHGRRSARGSTCR